MYKDEIFMKEALLLAEKAANMGEVPVGAVIVRDNKIISGGLNRRESGKNALLHAEIEAINSACTALGGWRLWQCKMYVTLEPCPMCAGAVINARIPELYFGAYDKNNGACGSAVNLFTLPNNFRPEVHGGILEDDCRRLLTDFFKRLR